MADRNQQKADWHYNKIRTDFVSIVLKVTGAVLNET